MPEIPDAQYRKGEEIELPNEIFLFFKTRMPGALELLPEEKAKKTPEKAKPPEKDKE